MEKEERRRNLRFSLSIMVYMTKVSDDSEKEKFVMAYLPPGYDDSDGPYNILYLILVY